VTAISLKTFSLSFFAGHRFCTYLLPIRNSSFAYAQLSVVKGVKGLAEATVCRAKDNILASEKQLS
jgi:hypothetical protein